MKIILFIINLVISLYGTAPIFTNCESLPDDREGQVYITVDQGICLDEFGNGMLYEYDSDFNYISYSRVKNAKAGDLIYTFCIMDPNSNYIDDIIVRIDIIESSADISIDMDNITKYIVTEYGIQIYFEDGTGFYWEYE